MKTQDILPVLLSILIIILVAVLEKQSRLVAAITATMPLTAALGLWIVYASSGGQEESLRQFTSGMLIGVLPTLGFLVAVWAGARVGLRLIPLLTLGYAVWGLGLGLLLMIRRLAGWG